MKMRGKSKQVLSKDEFEAEDRESIPEIEAGERGHAEVSPRCS